MTGKRSKSSMLTQSGLSRRTLIKGAAAGAGLMMGPGFVRYAQAQSSEPIKIGFQAHGPVSARLTAAGTSVPPTRPRR